MRRVTRSTNHTKDCTTVDILIETSDIDELSDDQLRDIENTVTESLESHGWFVANVTITGRGQITPNLPT